MPSGSMHRKESRRARLLELLSRERRPVRFAELVEAYIGRHPSNARGHDSLSSALGALLYIGQIVMEERRRGHATYRLG